MQTDNSIKIAGIPKKLDQLGITDLYDGLESCGSTAARLGETWDRLTSDFQALSTFLMLGLPIESMFAERPLVSSVLSLLEPLKIISHDNGLISLSGLVLERYRGVWFFADAPRFSPTLYFGYDSIGLARRLQSSPNGKALDLCSGPGIQALILAQGGMKTTAIDINPIASDLCELNASINGLKKTMTIVSGNLYDAVDPEERFDLIVANPPLLPIPEGVPYPFIGDGGPDGSDVVIEILSGAHDRLTQSGTLLLIGMTTYKDGKIIPEKRISAALEESKLIGLMSIISTYETRRDRSWVQGLAISSIKHNSEKYSSVSDAEAHIVKEYSNLGATHVCTYVLRAWSDSLIDLPRLRIQDFSGNMEGQNPWRI